MEMHLNNITQFLDESDLNNQDVLNQMFELLYPIIKKLASKQLNKLNPKNSVNATHLVHECYLKLSNTKNISIKNRQHFYSIASRCMRFFLVDLVRKSQNQKNKALETDVNLTKIVYEDDLDFKLLELDRLLDQLSAIDNELANISELKFFGGFTFEEIAEMKELPLSTIYKKWSMAKSCLINLMTSKIDK